MGVFLNRLIFSIENGGVIWEKMGEYNVMIRFAIEVNFHHTTLRHTIYFTMHIKTSHRQPANLRTGTLVTHTPTTLRTVTHAHTTH